MYSVHNTLYTVLHTLYILYMRTKKYIVHLELSKITIMNSIVYYIYNYVTRITTTSYILLAKCEVYLNKGIVCRNYICPFKELTHCNHLPFLTVLWYIYGRSYRRQCWFVYSNTTAEHSCAVVNCPS